MITKERVDGKFSHNVYTLLDKSEWNPINHRPPMAHGEVNQPQVKSTIGQITTTVKRTTKDNKIYKDNKDIYKDNKREGDFPPNPRKEMEFFLNSKEYFDNVITHFTEKMNIPEEQVKLEVQKFQLYWTEPSKDGKKQRWEMQKTWDVKRRLLTWFSKQKEWNQSKVKKRKVTMTF